MLFSIVLELTRNVPKLAIAPPKPALLSLIVEFSSPYLGKGWALHKAPRLPLHCRIRLGRRFDPPRDPRAFTIELEAHLRAELAGPSTP